MNKPIIFLLFLFLLVGCSKDKKSAKLLVGEWKAVTYYESHTTYSAELISEDNYALTMVFNSCFIKRNGFCLMDWTESYPTEGKTTKSLDYRVTGSGNSLEMRAPETPETIANFDIITLTEEDLVLDLTNVSGLVTTITLEKQ